RLAGKRIVAWRSRGPIRGRNVNGCRAGRGRALHYNGGVADSLGDGISAGGKGKRRQHGHGAILKNLDRELPTPIDDGAVFSPPPPMKKNFLACEMRFWNMARSSALWDLTDRCNELSQYYAR